LIKLSLNWFEFISICNNLKASSNSVLRTVFPFLIIKTLSLIENVPNSFKADCPNNNGAF